MPVSSAAFNRYVSPTTYSTSYGSSSVSVPRGLSGGRKSSISNGYTSQVSTSNYRQSSRPLPPGPGPLDTSGRKLSGFSVTSGLSSNETWRNKSSNGVVPRSGPLKADHSSSFGYNASSNYLSDRGRTSYGAVSRPLASNRLGSINGAAAYGSDFSTRPLSGTSRPGKSSSLIDLSNLNISDSNYSSNRNRATSVFSDNYSSVGRSSNSSSRNRNYRDISNDEIFSRVSRASHLDGERPDGTSRTRYTPSMSRDLSPMSPASRRNGLSGDTDESPTKSSLSNLSSSSSMSSGSTSYSVPSYPGTSRFYGAYVTHPASREQFVERKVWSWPNVIDLLHLACPTCMCAELKKQIAIGEEDIAAKYKDGGRVGLRNLGNTCFMNSVLQCLSNTRLLLEWCLDERYLQDINTTTSNMKGSLIRAYANLMQSMWKGRNESYVSPDAFKTQIQKFAPRFMGFAQQDSQEFLRYLLEGLHEDVNRVMKKPAPIILDDNQLEKRSDSGKAQEYWKAYLNRDNSMIVDIFVGQLKSELKFTSCGHRSVTFDPFWDLSLPIVKGSHEVNLEDCIRLFMKEEELAAEERPMCTQCKSRKSCTKSFSIQRFPKILVLHLKRFSQQERFGRKLTTLVDFPIKSLNLSEYAADGMSGEHVRYDLYAVSNHTGGTSSGHYTAYCKNPYSGDWHFFNDARVSSPHFNQVVSAEAYVLFYELCS